MQFDMQAVSVGADFTTYPDWPFSAVPRTDIGEEVFLTGSGTRAGGSVTGTPDQTEC